MSFTALTLPEEHFVAKRRARCFAPSLSDDSAVDISTWGIPGSKCEGDQCVGRIHHGQVAIRAASGLSLVNKDGADLVYLRMSQSRTQGRLNITYAFYEELVKHFQISVRVENLLVGLGPGAHIVALACPPATFGSSVTREGDFEIFYVLYFVEQHGRPMPQTPWSQRQSFIYHRRRASSSPSTFLTVSVSKSIDAQVNHCLGSMVESTFSCSVGVHVELLRSAVSTWREYLVYTEEQIQDMNDRALVSEPSQHALKDRTALEPVADELAEAIEALSHSMHTCGQLQMMHDLFRTDQQGTDDCSHIAISNALSAIRVDIEHSKVHITRLNRKIRRIEQLITDLLELSDSHAMKDLAVDSQTQARAMEAMAKSANRDAAAVKILTVVTLVYLPATAVLNFFSTDFVATKRRDDGSSTLIVTSNWWVAIAVAAPLTLVTVYIWWTYVRLKIDRIPAKRAFLGNNAVLLIRQCCDRFRPRRGVKKDSEGGVQ